MDFQINLPGEMSFVKNTDIRSNVYLSLYINQGDWFYDPTFGCQLWALRKISDSNLLLARQYVEQALQWLITVGKASSIDVLVERDLTNLNQMDIKITVTQPNAVEMYYRQAYNVQTGTAVFIEINGPTTHALGNVWYNPVVSPTQGA